MSLSTRNSPSPGPGLRSGPQNHNDPDDLIDDPNIGLPISKVPEIRMLLKRWCNIPRRHEEKPLFIDFSRSLRELGDYGRVEWWRNHIREDPEMDLEEEVGEEIVKSQGRLFQRIKTWNKRAERMFTIKLQSVLSTILRHCSNTVDLTQRVYGILTNDEHAFLCLFEQLADYEFSERQRISFIRNRRLLSQNKYFIHRNFKLSQGVFLEWKRIMVYSRDIDVLRDYIEKSKSAISKAEKANQEKEGFLKKIKYMEEVLLPELDSLKLEVVSLRGENTRLVLRAEELENELMQVKMWLEKEKLRVGNLEMRIRRFINGGNGNEKSSIKKGLGKSTKGASKSEQSTVTDSSQSIQSNAKIVKLIQQRDRWCEESLLRWFISGVLQESLRNCRELIRRLKQTNEDQAKQALQDQEEILSLKNNVAQKEIEIDRLENQVKHNIERKKHYSERCRMGDEDLIYHQSKRVEHEFTIRKVLEPKIQEWEQRYNKLQKEYSDQQEKWYNQKKDLEQRLQDITKKYKSEQQQKEILQMQVSGLIEDKQNLILSSQSLRGELSELKIVNEVLKKEHNEMSQLTKGLGPPIPGGYLCMKCGEDVVMQRKVVRGQGLQLGSLSNQKSTRQLAELLLDRREIDEYEAVCEMMIDEYPKEKSRSRSPKKVKTKRESDADSNQNLDPSAVDAQRRGSPSRVYQQDKNLKRPLYDSPNKHANRAIQLPKIMQQGQTGKQMSESESKSQQQSVSPEKTSNQTNSKIIAQQGTKITSQKSLTKSQSSPTKSVKFDYSHTIPGSTRAKQIEQSEEKQKQIRESLNKRIRGETSESLKEDQQENLQEDQQVESDERVEEEKLEIDELQQVQVESVEKEKEIIDEQQDQQVESQADFRVAAEAATVKDQNRVQDQQQEESKNDNLDANGTAANDDDDPDINDEPLRVSAVQTISPNQTNGNAKIDNNLKLNESDQNSILSSVLKTVGNDDDIDNDDENEHQNMPQINPIPVTHLVTDNSNIQINTNSQDLPSMRRSNQMPPLSSTAVALKQEKGFGTFLTDEFESDHDIENKEQVQENQNDDNIINESNSNFIISENNTTTHADLKYKNHYNYGIEAYVCNMNVIDTDPDTVAVNETETDKKSNLKRSSSGASSRSNLSNSNLLDVDYKPKLNTDSGPGETELEVEKNLAAFSALEDSLEGELDVD